MTINLSTLARNKAGNAIVDLIDLGSATNKGYIEFFDGTKAANPQTATSGNILAVLEFSLPAFKDFVNGQSSAENISDGIIIKSGKATWFRVRDLDRRAIFDGDVSDVGGNGDIKFNDTNFVIGGSITITNLSAVMPE